MERDDGRARPQGRETGCSYSPCAASCRASGSAQQRGGVSSCAHFTSTRCVKSGSEKSISFTAPWFHVIGLDRNWTRRSKQEYIIRGNNITPEEVIWLYDQMLEWMVSGFQVSYCSCRITSAGNAPRLSWLMAGGMFMLSLEHYGWENGPRRPCFCFYLYLVRTWPSSLAFPPFCAGATGHRWGSRSCWCTVIRKYSRTGSFIMLTLDRNAF